MHEQVKPSNVMRIENELKVLRVNLSNLDAWKEEKNLIQAQINAYGSINFNEIGFKSGGTTYELTDLLISDTAKINTLESKIDYTEYTYNKMKIYINKLNEDEQKVINNKYIFTDGNDVSFEKLAKIVKYSKSHTKRLHDSALQKMAYSKYESLEIA